MKTMAFTLQQSLAILAVAIFAHTSSAQENPICYVCSDNGVSTVTKPTNSIPLPSFLNVGPITCGQIQVAGEILRVLTPEACSYLNTNTFRVTCGCENAIVTAPVAPVAAPVSVSAPTKEVKLVGGGAQMKCPSSCPSVYHSVAVKHFHLCLPGNASSIHPIRLGDI